MEPILALNNVTYCRGKEFALTIEHLELLPGRIYLLSGANGAGKSTLLQLLAQLLAPDGGEIRFSGNLVRGRGGRNRLRRKITLVEQSPFLFDATVYGNLSFGLKLRDIPVDLQRRRIAEALQIVGLGGFESRRAQALSGGEARRVALARAMVLRPSILLLDEPTAGLDRDALLLFERCLAALADEGVAVVASTHDAEQSRRLPVETLRLEAGRLMPQAA